VFRFFIRWVRDKLLGKQTKDDIDIAIDNMSGKTFAEAVNKWLQRQGEKTFAIGVIGQNPDKSKHLETAAVRIGNFSVDFSNLRTEVRATVILLLECSSLY